MDLVAGDSPNRSDGPGGLVVAALAAVAAWGGFLAWDIDKDVVGNNETGPWEAWQVLGYVATVAVVAFVAFLLRRDDLRLGVILSVVVTGCFVASATVLAPPTPDASLWPIAAAVILVGAAVGCAALALLAGLVRRVVRPERAAVDER